MDPFASGGIRRTAAGRSETARALGQDRRRTPGGGRRHVTVPPVDARPPRDRLTRAARWFAALAGVAPVATAAIAFGFFRGADLGHGRVYLALGAALGALYFITVPLVVVAVGVTSIAWLRRRRDRTSRAATAPQRRRAARIGGD